MDLLSDYILYFSAEKAIKISIPNAL